MRTLRNIQQGDRNEHFESISHAPFIVQKM